ncbi:hypothetical protein M9H77_31680 [Catharanthus roseus]|uniref:Uncharacterized protein n=1 Tax=Catharanthus roseus TaxID=4058 RepID=A0ACC0A0V2_CATRO|nr:hypothetical protein M9H77_31680 [Catharanthus roseus]
MYYYASQLEHSPNYFKALIIHEMEYMKSLFNVNAVTDPTRTTIKGDRRKKKSNKKCDFILLFSYSFSTLAYCLSLSISEIFISKFHFILLLEFAYFILPVGELTLTPMDFTSITGLRIRNRPDYIKEMLGWSQNLLPVVGRYDPFVVFEGIRSCRGYKFMGTIAQQKTKSIGGYNFV